jgi:hypothetical protein
MKIQELANKLKAIYDQHGDIEVMFSDPNTGSTYGAFIVEHRVAELDEFPEDWDMPEGFEFVEITQ